MDLASVLTAQLFRKSFSVAPGSGKPVQKASLRPKRAVWKADYSPFGEADITSQGLTFNLRFPGQYYDAETGLHYVQAGLHAGLEHQLDQRSRAGERSSRCIRATTSPLACASAKIPRIASYWRYSRANHTAVANGDNT